MRKPYPASLHVSDIKLSRRQLLKAAAGGAVVLAGAGYGVDQLLSSPPPTRAPRFKSRPDLNPPPVSTVVKPRHTARGLIMLSAARTPEYQHGPMIINDHGHMLWFDPQVHASLNLQIQTYLGQKVLTWWAGRIVVPGDYGHGEYVIAGPDYQELKRVRAGNGFMGDLHEFKLTPEGTALITIYQVVDRNLTSVGGAKHGKLLTCLLQEIDIETGQVLLQWESIKHVKLHESYLAPGSGSDLFDYFHINSIEVMDDGNLLVSARNTFALYKIHRLTGEVMWRLGGKHSDFEIGPRAKFAFQHDARVHHSGVVTLFDDGAGPPDVQSVSRGLKLHVNQNAMRVHLIREYLCDPSVLATSQGSVQVMPNGNVFVGWGIEPYFSEYRADGKLLFEGALGAGSSSYRARRSVWVGRPPDVPVIAVERLGMGSLNVYASWNGATEIERWEVLGGGSPETLSGVGSFPWEGFETKMHVITSGAYLAVEAMNAAGEVLGRSTALLLGA